MYTIRLKERRPLFPKWPQSQNYYYKISNVFLNLRKMTFAFQLLFNLFGVALFFVARGRSDICWSSSAVNVERQRKRHQILVLLGDCDKAAFL